MARVKVVLLAVAALLLISTPAFPHGEVGCEGCHTMHNSKNGLPIVPIVGAFLLRAMNISSVCLNCHEGAADSGPAPHHISTPGVSSTSPPVQMSPGGDFGWLKIDYPTIIGGASGINKGERRGHNIVADEFGYKVDSLLILSPGGSYPAAKLGCTSCHDPHGQYRRFADGTYHLTGLPISGSGSYNTSPDPIAGISAVTSYRMLGGVGYQFQINYNGGAGFVNPPPDVVAPASYNRSEASGQTHVAYGRGMSEWCANCHAEMIENGYNSGTANHGHPAGANAKLTDAIVANYNSYVSSGILTNTDLTRSYSTLAPFELGSGDYNVLKSLAVTSDTVDMSARVTGNVMCLSCHRAHASGFEHLLRFQMGGEVTTIADATGNAIYDPSTTDNEVNQGLDVAAQTNAYYGRPASALGPYARNYCNKCHAKD